jgi:hypothetical protein
MQPHPWIVEFAIRDEQEREKRLLQRADRNRAVAPVVVRPRLVRRGLDAVGQLLIRIGGSLVQLGSADVPWPSPGGQTATR